MANKPAETKVNHKAMDESPIVSQLSQLGEIRFDPTREGGFVWNQQTQLPTHFIRSPFWRAEENDPAVRENDVRPMYTQPKESVSLGGVETGGELEMYVWDPASGREAPAMGPQSTMSATLDHAKEYGTPFDYEDAIFAELEDSNKKIGYSAELAASCIEMNFHHTIDTYQAALSMSRSLKTLAMAAEKEGWKLIPTSSFGHRPLEKEDINQDSYVQRIAHDYMGWDNVKHFIGSSYQVHVEMLDLESGLKAINMYQHIAPLLYALSLAGPFADGKVEPNLREVYLKDESQQKRLQDVETYNAIDSSDWMSIRYPSRWRGSPSGGSYEEPLPENSADFFALAEAGLRDNNPHSEKNIPSPARAAGHHRDRVRTDIGPNGTLEISNMDTFGGNVLKIAAIQEFTRVMMWKMQLYAKAGNMGELAARFPHLFPPTTTVDTLRTAHLNSIEVAKHGVEGNIVSADGSTQNVQSLVGELIAFVNEPMHDEAQAIHFDGLPKNIVSEVMKSAVIPSTSQYQRFADQDGYTSVKGFYETGVGTLSHWMKQRAKELKASGMGDEEAIKNCMTDLGASYHQFLTSLNGNIKELFRE